MYNSKDSIIIIINTEYYYSIIIILLLIQNPPPIEDNNLTVSIVKFFNSKLQANIQTRDIKACHPLGETPGSPVTVNFIYFEQKNFIWISKKFTQRGTTVLPFEKGAK